MGRKFDLLVFDWDGTILDSTGAIVRAIQASCLDLGLPEPSYLHASQVIGLGLIEVLQHSAPTLPADRIPEMIERYRFHFLANDHQLEPFQGMRELLADLRDAGFALAVATGKSRVGLNRALSFSGLAGLFAATRCADECFSKPHPQMLEELMLELGASPDRTLMIGDTTHDLQMAINAKVAGLAVGYGAHSKEVLLALNPLACLDHVAHLGGWLRANA